LRIPVRQHDRDVAWQVENAPIGDLAHGANRVVEGRALELRQGEGDVEDAVIVQQLAADQVGQRAADRQFPDARIAVDVDDHGRCSSPAKGKSMSLG